MGSVIGIKGQTLNINLLQDSRDNGWTISDGKAVHSGCNQGYIELLNASYTVGVPNVFQYVVSGYGTGSVNIQVGDVDGPEEASNGVKTATITPQNGDAVRFWSDGNVTVDILAIYPVTTESNAVTIGFSEDNNKFVSYYGYEPEMMVSALNMFLTSKLGGTWRHGVNPITNSFYGVVTPSIITFYCNISPSTVKNFYSMREKSDKVWSVTDIEIPPRYGKPNGQKSRLKKGRFVSLQGDWFADFLRDMNDPRFFDSLEALLKGAELQGNIMKITIENSDSGNVRLMSIDVIVSASQYTY